MPLYEYECLKCGERFETIQKFSDAPFQMHRENGDVPCDGTVRKLLAAPAIQFKGTGWYVTDYGRGGKKPASEASGSGAKDGAAAGDSKKGAAEKSSAKSEKASSKNGASK